MTVVSLSLEVLMKTKNKKIKIKKSDRRPKGKRQSSSQMYNHPRKDYHA